MRKLLILCILLMSSCSTSKQNVTIKVNKDDKIRLRYYDYSKKIFNNTNQLC